MTCAIGSSCWAICAEESAGIASTVRPHLWRAIGLAVGSVAAGLVGIWVYAGLEGGTLGLVDYLGQVHGPLVLVEIAVAAVVAFVVIR